MDRACPHTCASFQFWREKREKIKNDHRIQCNHRSHPPLFALTPFPSSVLSFLSSPIQLHSTRSYWISEWMSSLFQSSNPPQRPLATAIHGCTSVPLLTNTPLPSLLLFSSLLWPFLPTHSIITLHFSLTLAFFTFRFLSSFEPSLSTLGHSFRRLLKFLTELRTE